MEARDLGKELARGSPPAVVLLAHVDPPVHGQAVMASALVEGAARWTRLRLRVVNAVYARRRASLASFSGAKVVLTIRHLASAVRTVRRTRARLVVVTPAFYAGPFLKDAFVICMLKALTPARVVAWVHMDPARLRLDERPWWYRRVAGFALRRVDAWVACAPRLLSQWPAFIPQARSFAVANGISPPPTSQARGVRSETIRVCFLSSLEDDKGWTDLLAVADEICATIADVEFHVYGDVGRGWSDEAVRSRFRACTFSDRIVWHGPVEGVEKWNCLAAADLFCLPSRTEQFPLVILEAMASGLAIVATRVGAVEDAVIDGQGGWLVEPGSRDDLLRALADALSDRDRLERFGRFNLERQRSEYGIDRFAERWEQFLASLVTERRHAG